MDTNILLESGTNELEVLEFTLGNNHYGINENQRDFELLSDYAGTEFTSEYRRNLHAA